VDWLKAGSSPRLTSWKARLVGLEGRFIELAGQINGRMPAHGVGKIARAPNGARNPVKDSRNAFKGRRAVKITRV